MSLSNYIYQFEVLDTSSTVGSGLAGLAYTDFTVKFCHPGGTLVSATTQDITTLGTYEAPTSSSHIRIKELNGTNPTVGIYEAHLHNDRVSETNGDRLWIYMSVSGAKISPYELDLKKQFADLQYIVGDSGAAQNFKNQYNGSGLVGAAYPAYQAQISSLSLLGGGGGGLSEVVDYDNTSGVLKGITFSGVLTAGTWNSLVTNDGSYVTIDDTTNIIDYVTRFTIPTNSVPSIVQVDGYLNGVGDTAIIAVYDNTDSIWSTKATMVGQSNTDNVSYPIPLGRSRFVDGSGNVYVRFQTTAGANQQLNLDRVTVDYINQTIGYSDGAIWIDTSLSNTSTVNFVDGTADNPVSTWAAAKALSASLGIKRFKVAGGSSLTLDANSDNYTILGDGLFNLNLGSQSIADLYVKHAVISGTGTGLGAVFEDCRIQNSTSTAPAYFVRCGLNTNAGTPYLANGSGDYVFVDCVSLVAGNNPPYFDFNGTGGNTNVSFRRWSGGINSTLSQYCSASFDVAQGGTVTVNANGSPSVAVRGITRGLNITCSGLEVVQFAGITGHVIVNGVATSGTIKLTGITADVTNSGTNIYIDDDSINQANVADTVLTRDFAAVSGAASRSLINSARFLRNNWYTADNYVYITKEDDTTVAWSGQLSLVSAGSGITGMDPL